MKHILDQYATVLCTAAKIGSFKRELKALPGHNTRITVKAIDATHAIDVVGMKYHAMKVGKDGGPIRMEGGGGRVVEPFELEWVADITAVWEGQAEQILELGVEAFRKSLESEMLKIMATLPLDKMADSLTAAKAASRLV